MKLLPISAACILVALLFLALPAAGTGLSEWLREQLLLGGIFSGTFLLRYLLIAGLAYLIFYHWKRKRWQHKRLQPQWPAQAALQREVGYSLSTFLIFGLIGIATHQARQRGYTLIYTDVSEYGWAYLVLSVLLALLLHDTYFYWTHRLMHHKRLFAVFHKVHHLSHNPSPWASFSFHPLEAVVEGAILPLLVCVLPLHPLAILLFLLIMTVINVIGHLGYELYPAGFMHHWLGRWNNTSTHHNLHHRYNRGNYGLYFNWWDRWMGTNHPRYEEHFTEIASRVRADALEPQPEP